MGKPSILLVEDDAILRMDLKAFLGSIGFEVAAACSTAEEAVEMATRVNPDAVVMDIILPGDLDGVEAARMIRASLRVPVIFLTGHFNEFTIERARVIEPEGYLLKPYDRQTLRRTLESAVRRARPAEPAEETTSWFNFVKRGSPNGQTGPDLSFG